MAAKTSITVTADEGFREPVTSWQKLRGLYPSLTPSEQRVARLILDKGAEILRGSMDELAQSARTSKATVHRLAVALGYDGFSEMRLSLARDSETIFPNLFRAIEETDTLTTIGGKLLRANVSALEATLGLADEGTYNWAVQAICNASKVQLFGVGSSGLVAEDAQFKFHRVKVAATAFTDLQRQLVAASMLDEGDVSLLISHSGSTPEIVEVASMIRRRAGAVMIALTGSPRSPLAKVADAALLSSAYDPPLRSGGVVSRTAQLFVIDLLTLGVARERGREMETHLDDLNKLVTGRRPGRRGPGGGGGS